MRARQVVLLGEAVRHHQLFPRGVRRRAGKLKLLETRGLLPVHRLKTRVLLLATDTACSQVGARYGAIPGVGQMLVDTRRTLRHACVRGRGAWRIDADCHLSRRVSRFRHPGLTRIRMRTDVPNGVNPGHGVTAGPNSRHATTRSCACSGFSQKTTGLIGAPGKSACGKFRRFLVTTNAEPALPRNHSALRKEGRLPL